MDHYAYAKHLCGAEQSSNTSLAGKHQDEAFARLRTGTERPNRTCRRVCTSRDKSRIIVITMGKEGGAGGRKAAVQEIRRRERLEAERAASRTASRQFLSLRHRHSRVSKVASLWDHAMSTTNRACLIMAAIHDKGGKHWLTTRARQAPTSNPCMHMLLSTHVEKMTESCEMNIGETA